VYHISDEGTVHVSWADLFDFVVNSTGSRIDVYAGDTSNIEDAYTYLVSQVISVALLQRGMESLHASAVVLGDDAIAIVGDSGYGKSTLVASLMLRDAALLTDDLLVVERYRSEFRVLPGFARLKLHPSTAQDLGVTWMSAPMIDGSGKHVYTPRAEQTSSDPKPLRAVFLLAPGAKEPAVRAATSSDAMHAILGATFNPLHTEAVRLTRLMRLANDIVTSTRVFHLDVPRDLRSLETVGALVRKQIRLG
jgi:hypothetical protein